MRRQVLSYSLAAVIAVALLAATSPAQAQYTTLPRPAIERRLNQFAGENLERALTLHQMFTQVGCAGKDISDQIVTGLREPNIICVLPGSGPQIIIVGAHFDHVPNSLGVVDNWSGASLLPSLFESLKSAPRQHTYVFIGFAGGEQEEAGSHAYAKSLTKQARAQVTAMINLESIGLTPAKVWAKHGDKRLVDAIYAVAEQVKLPVTSVDMPESTDSEGFRQQKMPVLTIHSLTQEAWNSKAIHGNQDQLTAINLDQYYETYKLLAAFLAYLDAPPAQDSPAAPKSQ